MSPTANPAVSDLIFLFRFNMLFYRAKGLAYRIEMRDGANGEVEAHFTPGRADKTTH